MRKVVCLLIAALLTVAGFSQRMIAEWEPAYGTLIRWPLGIPAELVLKLAESDTLYVLIENETQKNEAIQSFTSWNINLDHCQFIFANTYSHWTRDWGPQFFFNREGKAEICDPYFDGYPWVPGCNNSSVFTNLIKGYEEDDTVNQVLGPYFNMNVMELPLYLTGGNIMTDGEGTAISTRQMLNENASFCDESCFRNTCRDSLGLKHYFILENPENYGIQHIDCHAKFLDEETILVKQLPQSHPEYECSEYLAETLASLNSCYNRPYKIKRIFCDYYSGNKAAAYTNSLILNKKVFVPLFGINADQQAIQTYQEAMPGYEIIGIYSESWYYYDALHCRTMGIFDPGMLRITHKCPGKAPANEDIMLKAFIDDRSENGLIENELLIHWRIHGNKSWESSNLYPAMQADSFLVILPAFSDGTLIDYYFSASDSSGRNEKQPRVAPVSFYSLEITESVQIHNTHHNTDFAVYQKNNQLIITTNGIANEPVDLVLFDIHGQLLYKRKIIPSNRIIHIPLTNFSKKTTIFIKLGLSPCKTVII